MISESAKQSSSPDRHLRKSFSSRASSCERSLSYAIRASSRILRRCAFVKVGSMLSTVNAAQLCIEDQAPRAGRRAGHLLSMTSEEEVDPATPGLRSSRWRGRGGRGEAEVEGRAAAGLG